MYYHRIPHSCAVDVYKTALRVVEQAGIANSAAETARLTALAYYESLDTYQQVVAYQRNTALSGSWSSTFDSMTPIDDILSLDAAQIRANIERLRRHSYGNTSFESPIVGGSHPRQFVDNQPYRDA